MLKALIAAKAYQFLSAAVRNGLVSLGAYLAANDLASPEQTLSLTTTGVWAFGVAWSYARKLWPDLKF